MGKDECEEKITAIYLKNNYALSFLESLSDEELNRLYERHLEK
ncbi:hypothetical protein OXB_3006 [Bacillus sp. OxB-1]|nr:BH0509 family protein [Bacillus sp. OxB-1]BAQ11476.1 hypothetical protein OXB_3006 [Bacillus sp. OxB-1]